METQIAKYLADEMEEAERKQFEEQLLSDDELSEELQKSIASWEVSSVYKNSDLNFDADAAWSKMAGQLTIQRNIEPEKTRFSFLKIAASIILVAAAGYFLLKESNLINVDDSDFLLVESSDQVEELILLDGSLIRLNANSSISYDEAFGKEHRNVTLIGGANFDVERNEDLPFIITTANSQVEVLGTSFEVSAYDNESVEVNVTSGRVGFKSTKAKGEPAVLEAGDRAVLSADGMQMQRGKTKNNNFSAWWTREFVFEDTKLSEVVKDLEKAYWVNIELSVSDSEEECRVSQIFKAATLEKALEVLEATLPKLKITKDKENNIKLGGSCK